MPEKETLRRAAKDKREGKSASTQAGEFVREEIHHIREGKHGARSAKQAIAIGLSKARRAGVDLPPQEEGKQAAKRKEQGDRAAGKRKKAARKTGGTKSRRRARAVTKALQREGDSAASTTALSRQASASARKRTAADRSAAAKKAARTKGAAGRTAAAKKAARTRAAAHG